MNDFFNKYTWTLIEIITGFFSISLIMSIFTNTVVLNSSSLNSIDQTVIAPHTVYDIPEISVSDFNVKSAILNINDSFDWRDYVNVNNEQIDIMSYITVDGYVDTSKSGEYTLLFQFNFNGVSINKECVYYVREG